MGEYEDPRESWDSYFIQLAVQVAARGTCPRRQVGAVLTQKNHLRSTGYNGSSSGQPHCLEVGCLLNGEGRCQRTIHAEANAIRDAHPTALENGVLFVTDMPCPGCAKLIACCPLKEVVYLRPYHAADAKESEDIIQEAGIALRQYEPLLEQDYPAHSD